jgi:hypothetical protein
LLKKHTRMYICFSVTFRCKDFAGEPDEGVSVQL